MPEVRLEADSDAVMRDTGILRAMLLRMSDTPAHAVNVAASLLANCLVIDLPEIFGKEAAMQIAEQLLEKLIKDVRERVAEKGGIESVNIHVRSTQ